MRPLIKSLAVSFALLTGMASLSRGQSGSPIQLDGDTQAKCLAVLREGLRSDEFWPSMHAAEALSLSGHAAEVREALESKIASEKDDQRRCGLARELVRAGDLRHLRVLVEVLASDNPYGHVHACESLYKVFELGDSRAMRRAMTQTANPVQSIMAAGALARWGSREALESLRSRVVDPDPNISRIAAWVLARVGTREDIPALRAGVQSNADALTRCYFEHALAALKDKAGVAALIRNLGNSDAAVRVYACEFAPEAGAAVASDALRGLLSDPVLDVRIRAAQALLQLSSPPAAAREEEIARDVYVATERNPRYSEGSIVVLSDGKLLYATTEFQGSESDFATAQIIAKESADGGRSWGMPRVLQENVGQNNVMSVTLRRLSYVPFYDAPLGMFYLVKNSKTDLQVYLRVSRDDARSFGSPVPVTSRPGYHVLNNDRVTVLKSGRIVVPIASTSDVGTVNHFVCSCVLSDDGGRTWHHGDGRVDYSQRGAMEPEVCELSDGRLIMQIRTQSGHIAAAYSADQGETWSKAESWGVRAPEAPATLRRVPPTGELLLIWNDTFQSGAGHGGRRTPLTAAVSADEGQTWAHRRNLETDENHTYAYTSVAFHQGRVLLSYYVRDEKSGRISSRFRSLPIRWFYER